MNYSRQRQEILEQLKQHRDHPTADVIFAELRNRNSSISLATVYRNLNLLSDVGEIQRLSFESGADHFDPNVHPHYHFACEKCGRVLDVPMETASHLDEAAGSVLPGCRVTGHELVFRGLCEKCCSEEAQ